MEPELECRRSPGRCWLPLPCEDTEPLRTMRFVTVSPTGVGVVVWVRRAAAAAAEDRAPLDSRSRMKALVAASEAEAEGGRFEVCMEVWSVYGRQYTGVHAASVHSSNGKWTTTKANDNGAPPLAGRHVRDSRLPFCDCASCCGRHGCRRDCIPWGVRKLRVCGRVEKEVRLVMSCKHWRRHGKRRQGLA